MNLYEVVNSVESDWAILNLGPVCLNFKKEDISDNEENVIVYDEKMYFSIQKSVKFELFEESKHFMRFKIVGQIGHLSLHKK